VGRGGRKPTTEGGSGAVAVALGAFGAHGLKNVIKEASRLKVCTFVFCFFARWNFFC
jgi:hypothetical protein